VRLTTLPPSCAVAMKSGNLNFPEPCGPLQACNGTALPFTFPLNKTDIIKIELLVFNNITLQLHIHVLYGCTQRKQVVDCGF